MFEQTFKNIDDILHKDAGNTSELDYTEQTSWILFLKYLDALEQKKAIEAELEGRSYTFILDASYQWANWAAPKTADGKFDHNNAAIGDDLKDFVNQKLFPYLKGFKQRATGPNTIEYKIGEIFGEINNKLQSGYNLREVIERIDELRFNTQAEKHELSHLYEAKIKNMGNAGRNGGEYYTPRPLIRAMIRVTNPKIGETIYDGAVGSAGFLCEAFDYLRSQPNLSTSDLATLQTSTFYGKEKKSLAYVIAIMNMILHGIEAPNIIHTNTLAENISDIQEKDRFDIILANPPFGGKERAEVQQNFPIKTGETAFLFLQHFIKTLRAGGRAAVVIKNTFLSNTDNASVSLRKELLRNCNLHTVLDCPSGTFQGAGVKTVVLFFEKGAPTRNTWFYELDPGRNMGKTNPLNDADLVEFVELQKTFSDSPKSWSVNAASIDQTTFDLSVKNPNGIEEITHRSPQDIMAEIVALDAEKCGSVGWDYNVAMKVGWQMKTLGDVCDKASSNVSQNQLNNEVGEYPIFGASGLIKNVSFYHRDKPYLSIVKDGSGVGRVTKMDAFTSIIGTLQYILPNEGIDLDYLNYSLMSVDFKKYVAGAAIPHIYFKDYKNEPFLWVPLPEQKYLVAILDQAFEGIAKARANAEQNLQNARALFESHLQNMFENPKDNWQKKRWGDLCDFVRGPFGGSLTKSIFKESGYVVYEQKHAIHDHFNKLRYFINEDKFNEMIRFEVKPGDIIMSCSGVTLGRVAIVPEGIKRGIINQALLKLTPKENVSVHFIKHWLRSNIFQNIIFEYSGGAAIPNVPSAKILKDILIPCPSLKEQHRVVKDIESMSTETKKLEAIYQRKITLLNELKKSLLQQAFAGEL